MFEKNTFIGNQAKFAWQLKGSSASLGWLATGVEKSSLVGWLFGPPTTLEILTLARRDAWLRNP